MKVTLRAIGYIFDITKYVDLPIAQTKTLTGGFDTAQLIIPFVRANAVVNLDLSRKIPRMAIVEIEDLEETTQYYVINSQIDKLNATEYRHILELEELATILQLRAIPDYAVTQPKREDVVFVNEISNVVGDTITWPAPYTAMIKTLNLTTASITIDSAILENRKLKVAGDYKLMVNATIRGTLQTINSAQVYQDCELQVVVGGVVVDNYYIGTFISLTQRTIALTVDYENLIPNEEVELRFYGKHYSGLLTQPRSISVTASLEIVYQEAQTSEPIYLDYVVEKLLGMVNVIDKPEFTLDVTTKARLSNVLAFDDMQTDQTLYTAINRIANYVKAKPKVELIDGVKMLSFTYYSDLAKQDYVAPDNETSNALAQLNDYVSGLEIKNENILSNGYKTERLTLRTDQINQITTENITARVSSPIDKIEHVWILGIEMKDINGDVVLNNNTWFDIGNRVVEKPYYDVLDNMAYYNNRTARSKNNHLYFERGGNEIKGLAYIGAQYQANEFNELHHNRSLYETIACELAKDYTMPERVDKGLVYDNNIIIEVRYYPMNESNAVVLKDDQSGFEERITRKLNANDRVNNAEILGSFVRSKVNSVGGTRIAKNGIALGGEAVTKLGSMNGTYRVVTVTKYSYHDMIQFIATEVNEHIFESEYIGIDSDRRLYRVDKSEWVDRVDKSLSVFELSKTSLIKNTNAFNEDYVISILANNYTPRPPLMAHLIFDTKKLTIAVERNAIGNVIEWRVQALDNYNVEYEKIRTTFDNKDFVYQKGVEYCDLFGRADRLDVTFYGLRGASFNKTHYDLYPRTLLPLQNSLGGIVYDIKKDARERFILSNQLALLSTNKDFIVYNGLAKFNIMVAEKSYIIRLARLDYEPTKDDAVIDFTRSKEVTNDTTVNTSLNYFTFTADLGGHYAWYEEVTKELLLVVKNATVGVNTIYYTVRVNTFERNTEILAPENFVINSLLTLTETFVIKKTVPQTLNKELSVGVDMGLKTSRLHNANVELTPTVTLILTTAKTVQTVLNGSVTATVTFDYRKEETNRPMTINASLTTQVNLFYL